MPKTIPVPSTKEEIDLIIKEVADDDFYWTLFNLAKTTGRRLGEYYALKVSDIDFDKNIMMTIVLKKRRPDKREAILRPDITLMLRQFIVRNALKNDDYVFHGRSYRAIQNAATSAAKRAGINHPFSFHGFRHYFVTSLLKQGWHYDQIAKLTGHTTSQTLIHYDHVVASDMVDMAQEGIKNI